MELRPTCTGTSSRWAPCRTAERAGAGTCRRRRRSPGRAPDVMVTGSVAKRSTVDLRTVPGRISPGHPDRPIEQRRSGRHRHHRAEDRRAGCRVRRRTQRIVGDGGACLPRVEVLARGAGQIPAMDDQLVEPDLPGRRAGEVDPAYLCLPVPGVRSVPGGYQFRPAARGAVFASPTAIRGSSPPGRWRSRALGLSRPLLGRQC